MIDLAAFRERELYQEVFLPLGVEHQLVVTLPAPPRLLIGLVFADADDFSDDQKRLLDLARPHLIQAHANAALRERMHDVLAAIEAGLDDVGEAIVVTDAQDRIAFASAAGRAALALVDAGGRNERAPGAAARHAGPAHMVVPVAGGAPVMVRRLTPQGGTSVFLFERGSRGAPLSLLASLGLSPRETEVLQSMMRGNATAAIASQLDVSPRTVHKHAQRIYEKLGVNDRIAAVSAAWAAWTRAQPRLPERLALRNPAHCRGGGARRHSASMLAALRSLLVAVALAAAFAPTAFAQSDPPCGKTWGGSSGNWNDASKWVGGAAPNGQERACFPAGSYAVAFTPARARPRARRSAPASRSTSPSISSSTAATAACSTAARSPSPTARRCSAPSTTVAR